MKDKNFGLTMLDCDSSKKQKKETFSVNSPFIGKTIHDFSGMHILIKQTNSPYIPNFKRCLKFAPGATSDSLVIPYQ